MQSRRQRGIALIAVGAGALVLAMGVAPASVAATSSSTAAVLAGYRTIYAPAQATPVGWTGSVDGCDAGSESAASQRATIASINYARSLAGLSPVKLDTTTSSKAIQAALVYQANAQLSHDIPSGWDCVTADATLAGSKSNIALGLAGAAAITGYLDDPGSGNTVVGHRRWLLDPRLAKVGTGSTAAANAVWVIGGQKSSGYKNPSWVEWPTAGYFPSPLEPDGRWSLSGKAGVNYDFSKAKVTVTDGSGHKLAVKKRASTDGYASDTLVFDVSGVKKPTTSAAKAYKVTVSGIKVKGKTVTHRYTVKLVKP